MAQQWAWTVYTQEGVLAGAFVPRQARIRRRLSAPSFIDIEIDASALGAVELTVPGRAVRGFRAPAAGGTRVIRAAGEIAEIEAEAAVDSLERLTVLVGDGMNVLNGRIVQAPTGFAQETPRDIVAELVRLQNFRGSQPNADTGTQVAAGTGGPPRDRTYEEGKNVGEAIQQLAEVDDGFWYRVDPLEGSGSAPDRFSEIVLLHPDPGVARPEARLEWGLGTLGNLERVTSSILPPVNFVNAYGAGEGGDLLKNFKDDLASIAEFGLYDGVVTHADVTEIATLDQHALGALVPEPRRTFSVVPPLPHPALPVPWDDFDVGDAVRLRLAGDTPALQFDGEAIVTGFDALIDESGIERLASLDLIIEPQITSRLFRRARERLAGAIVGQERRIAELERLRSAT